MARLNTRVSYAASSRFASETPQPDATSDQENRHPTARSKGKAPAMAPPDRRSQANGAGQKRKRVRDECDDQDEEEDHNEDTGGYTKYYDPNQEVDERRQIKRKSRKLEREFNGEWKTGISGGCFQSISPKNH
jgi:non-structural maintenance of chromosomes element 4